jgi:TolC family type I secretion outer membrane protein
MRSLRHSSTALAILAFTACASVSVAHAESLADAIALAYQTNPTLLQQRAQLRAVNETYVQARAGAGPQLNVQAEFANQRLEDTRTGNIRTGDSATTSLNLSQPLFAGGRLAAATDAAEADVLAARERLRQAEQDLLTRVIAAYSAVRRDQQILEVARAAAAVLQTQLEETEAKVQVQENTRTDLAQAQARLASARSQLASYEAQLTISRSQYLAVVGQNPGQLEPEPDLPGLPVNPEQAFQVAEAENPSLNAAKRAEQATHARVAQARAQHLPSVNLRVQAARSPQSLAIPLPYSEAVTAQAVVTQPLFTSGLNASAVRRALELNNADRLAIDSTRRTVVQTVAQQWAQLVSARTALASDTATVNAAEAAFFGMRQEERFGLRSTIEVLNAQQELTQAQITLLRNRFTEFTSRAGLLAAVGRLNVDAIAPGVPVYDPKKDFDRVKNRYALPTEFVVRTIDGLVTPGLGKPRAARETTTPNQQAPLPPAPSDETLRAPVRSAAEIMNQTVAPEAERLPPTP